MSLRSKLRYFPVLWREPCYWIGHAYQYAGFERVADVVETHRRCRRCGLVETTLRQFRAAMSDTQQQEPWVGRAEAIEAGAAALRPLGRDAMPDGDT